MTDQKIRVAITSGDPNGIGLETIIKIFSNPMMSEDITPIIYAHPEAIKAHRKISGEEDFQYQTVADADQAIARKVNLVNIWPEFNAEIKFGKADKNAGLFALKSLEAAVKDLASNKVDVLVTAPINKDTIQSKDFNFPGHTEYLANFAGTTQVLMFLVCDDLKVGIVTGHLPLKDVAQHITKDKIIEKLKLMDSSLMKDFGVPKPKIAVLGLNPHAGDNGLLGSEEKDIILPAIREAADKGMYVSGPYSADGFFGNGTYHQFDAVLAMYHDQGLIPFKALAFENGVNFTAGLPVVRTSPDHGTGYNIAGQGIANEASMRNAIYTACDVFRKRKEYKEYTANPLKKQEIRDSKEDKKE